MSPLLYNIKEVMCHSRALESVTLQIILACLFPRYLAPFVTWSWRCSILIRSA